MSNLNKIMGGDASTSLIFKRSFQNFNRATDRLQKIFVSLEEKFENINRELEQKNIELEKAVAEKEKVKNYLHTILESLTAGVIVTDKEGKVTMMNRCAEIFTGIYEKDGKGRNVTFLFEDAAPLNSEGIFDILDIEENIGKKLVMKERTLEISRSPIEAKSHDKMGMVSVVRDITKIEKLEEMTKRTEKLAAMGELAANIAHEIRNPLGSIELFASLITKDCKEIKNRDRALQIIRSVKNVDNKISNLFLFARKQNPLMKKVDIHDVLREVLAFAGQIIEMEHIILSVKYDDAEPFVEGNVELLKQVFLNIIMNAYQSMPESGKLYIDTKIFGNENGKMETDKPNIKIRFIDNGVGISSENVKKIFDPFFTTKENGAGIGLAVVHNIVNIHGGSINVESGKTGGAVFHVTFPLMKGNTEI